MYVDLARFNKANKARARIDTRGIKKRRTAARRCICDWIRPRSIRQIWRRKWLRHFAWWKIKIITMIRFLLFRTPPLRGRGSSNRRTQAWRARSWCCMIRFVHAERSPSVSDESAVGATKESKLVHARRRVREGGELFIRETTLGLYNVIVSIKGCSCDRREAKATLV